ncbi:hypothetical protein VPH35_106088 [Triticum aestivum]|uniref:Uncharacterized protein n=1 Tax=Triticum turgidum subsp. durum TaxID=4567 RepID=A0A9R0Y793_TRITD|nr:unnamed protein product [Triticum turgidum subsp. durum]
MPFHANVVPMTSFSFSNLLFLISCNVMLVFPLFFMSTFRVSRRGNCSQGGGEDCQVRISYLCIHDFLQVCPLDLGGIPPVISFLNGWTSTSTHSGDRNKTEHM